MAVTKVPLNNFYKNLATGLFILLAAGYLAILLKEILSPILFAFLFAILLLPIASFLERKLGLPRSAASGLSVLFLVICLALILYLVGSQLSNLSNDWPLFKEQLHVAIVNLQKWVSEKSGMNSAKQLDLANEATSKVLSSSTSVLGATVLSLSSILLFLVFTLINTFLLLFYRRLMVKFLIHLFKEENSQIIYEIITEVQYIIRRFITGLLLEMVVVSGVCCGVLSLLGVKYAILLGLLTGLLNVIPYIGIFTAIALSALITFATGAEASRILAVVITLIMVHLADSNILFPWIVGSKVRINAFITLLGVIIGQILWGITGMFLAIPIIAMAKIIFDRIETLQPWGLLLGDEKDEKQTGKRWLQKKKIKKSL
ncbi:MAG: AI-2E family transporter [Flavitalea sp.]